MTYEAWRAEGTRRFGADTTTWRFVCPVCKHSQSVAECRAAGAPITAIGFSCIGRWLPPRQARDAFGGSGPGPCNYTGGGLFKLNPVTVTFPDGAEVQAFAFADDPARAAAETSTTAGQETRR